MVKMNGATYKDFLEDHSYWREDDYWENVVVLVNGEQQRHDDIFFRKIKDTDDIVIVSGCVHLADKKSSTMTVETFVRKWLKKQGSFKLVVECSDPSRIEEIRKTVLALGAKVR